MEFFISHIGWFVGLFFICLFATVGYFAEKNEKKLNENNEENIKKTKQETPKQETIDVNSIYDMNPIKIIENEEPQQENDYLQNNETINEPINYLIDVDGSNNFNSSEMSSEIEWNGSDEKTYNKEEPQSEKITNDDLSFENINMSFDDLERTDIDITNDSMGVTDSDSGEIDNYNYDDINSTEEELIIPNQKDEEELIIPQQENDEELIIPNKEDEEELVIPKKEETEQEEIWKI